MIELFKSGGMLMWFILFCSIVSMGIIVERFWSLRRKRIAPEGLTVKVWQWEKVGHMNHKRLQELRDSSPLGNILAAGVRNRHRSREVMKESIEEVGKHVTHDMERFLNTLGTIAAISPLLGLLGTVIGMIKVFAVITAQGVGDPSTLAEGISEALLTTAFGLSVAIPSLMFHRYFHGHIDNLILSMEQEAMNLVEVLSGKRDQDEMKP